MPKNRGKYLRWGRRRQLGEEVHEDNFGRKFRPTEEELVNYYLRKKKQDKDFKVDYIIPEIDICKYEPWDLPEPEYPYQDMFFFSPRDYKATERGFWKTTGKERVIKGAQGSNGRKKTFIFYEGRVPQCNRTNWVMHEYYLCEDEAIPNPKLAQQRDFVLCRLSKKADKHETSICAEAEPAYAEWVGISEECPQPEELELVFPALQLQDNISGEMEVVRVQWQLASGEHVTERRQKNVNDGTFGAENGGKYLRRGRRILGEQVHERLLGAKFQKPKHQCKLKGNLEK
ncbi:NAC domain-containing protein 14, partial [Prunus dulcis]